MHPHKERDPRAGRWASIYTGKTKMPISLEGLSRILSGTEQPHKPTKPEIGFLAAILEGPIPRMESTRPPEGGERK